MPADAESARPLEALGHVLTSAAACGGVSLTVLVYGTNTAGLLSMDQARGLAPRRARQRLVLAGGGLAFMLALALPALVSIRGTGSVYLALEGHGASGGAD